MHRIAATPGGWNPQDEGVVILEQTPAPIVILTAADTDIQTLAATLPHLPPQFPDIRVANLLHLVQQLSIDDYAERVLQHAQVIVVRLLGGRAYWSYGLEVVKELAENQGIALVVMPGEDAPDMELMSHSTVSLQQVNRLWRYWSEGGVENIRNGLLFLAGSVRVGSATGHQTQTISPSHQDTALSTIMSQKDPPKSPLKRGTVPAPLFKGGWGDQKAGHSSENCSIGEPAPTIGWEGENIAEPKPIPKVGVLPQNQALGQNWPKVGILFYRAHYCAGNTAPIESLCQALVQRQLTPVPVFVSSLRDNAPHRLGDRHCQEEILHLFQPPDNPPIQVLLNTTSFAIQSLQNTGRGEKFFAPTFFSTLDVPTLQVILSSSTVEQWQQGNRGLLPRDVAMNIALPEVDGRIITRAISFKATQTYNEQLQTDVVQYQPVADRVNFVADLAKNWVKLRQKPAKERKIALILANYPTRDGRLANGVGLDTPASCVQILAALQQAGYELEDIPETGDDLITRLTAGVTNDWEGNEIRLNRGGMGEWGNGEMGLSLSQDDYEQAFGQLPVEVQQGINNRWGGIGDGGVGAGSSISGWQDDMTREPALPERWVTQPMTSSSYPDVRAGSQTSGWEDQKLGEPAPTGFAIAGLNLGNVFVGIQPSRGYDLDPSLNYHAPDLEPTPHYLAFYQWIKDIFQADAVIHVGKHGNLEWLPGKSLALSECCYPEVALGTMPHLYPFIVNDPGEGSQAKRRSQAVILDHLTPPLTRAELYGPLQQLETLVDEYYEADSLDPSRLPAIQSRITALIRQEHLDQDLGLTPEDLTGVTSQLSTRIDGYLCELKEAQIRDGLHIFGQCPQGRQLRDLIVAISRSRPQGITRALAEDLGLDFDPLTTDPTTRLEPPVVIENKTYHQVGDVVEQLETLAANYVDQLLVGAGFASRHETPTILSSHPDMGEPAPTTEKELTWIAETLYPQLQATRQEITNLLRGLDGRYIASGPSGAPTRGRAEVLPTGRNFYSVDIRAIPTETAWGMARKAAEALIERYTQENGEYPKTLGLSMWGTSAMRTGGEDLAEALWLLGVQPVWDGPSRRVVDFEVVPVSVLGRPRVDVTLRISGFFRDGFPNLIDLFNQVVEKVAALDEPEEENPLAGTVRRETEKWRELGLSEEQARERSHYRMFGSKPGAYGAGLQGLIESQNWRSDEDLARAYLNWSSYAYTGQGDGQSAPEVFAQRLQDLQVVLHNQDNREHDLLDSDDYYQFQGGLTAAVRSLKGENPTVYFGDHAVMNHPRIRTLQEEINRVYRSRVINPKWIAGVMRHGYKGAFEMAATVDYLFAYDATTHCVADHIYDGVSEAYLLDPKVQEFVEKHNPWALRDMAERLLEAHQRGLWTSASAERVDELRAIVHQAEANIE
ncbi:cobaltochelatase subunit CobN [Roseofilum capinflatum]|uniref:Cobaltochelatase subunit CobN n=1 Tax=Roseofilum capinflatum BLCC-M114 TaxID=3022440 RepID=A0ABT7B0H2_9CYAN|nr:cobaltochelatase subunit CobN [Roseofilum capinflatum]MDJ1172645.1 cobaltochelatase subunit CobN [Roseofilum capinflatum BLCC-M114]